jgi:ABC-type polysaccharide/polyol phosphate transport system ATPase subunit
MAHLRLDDVSVEFPVYHASARSMRHYALAGAIGRRMNLQKSRATVPALSGVSLAIEAGQRVALVGENGAGKTTLLRTMAGIYEPETGRVVRAGSLTALLSLGMGINPEATGRENIFLLGMHIGIPPRQMRSAVDEIVAWTDLGAFIGAPLRTYSAGMTLRLAFAVSTAFPPEILLLDEWLGIADPAFQMRAYERMAGFVGKTAILVLASHAREMLETWCDRAVRLDGGRIVADGPLREVLGPRPAEDSLDRRNDSHLCP